MIYSLNNFCTYNSALNCLFFIYQKQIQPTKNSSRFPALPPAPILFLLFFTTGPHLLEGTTLSPALQFALIKPAAVREVKNSRWSTPPSSLHVDGHDSLISSRASTRSPLCGPCSENRTRVEGLFSREWRREERRNSWSPISSLYLSPPFSLRSFPYYYYYFFFYSLLLPASAGQPLYHCSNRFSDKQ